MGAKLGLHGTGLIPGFFLSPASGRFLFCLACFLKFEQHRVRRMNATQERETRQVLHCRQGAFADHSFKRRVRGVSGL